MVKAKLSTQNHTKEHTHTYSQKEKKEKKKSFGKSEVSASVLRVFCRSCSTCRCISDVFVGRKVISMSQSSAILKVSITFCFLKTHSHPLFHFILPSNLVDFKALLQGSVLRMPGGDCPGLPIFPWVLLEVVYDCLRIPELCFPL